MSDDTPTPEGRIAERLMARDHAASGRAIFVDPVIIAQIVREEMASREAEIATLRQDFEQWKSYSEANRLEWNRAEAENARLRTAIQAKAQAWRKTLALLEPNRDVSHYYRGELDCLKACADELDALAAQMQQEIEALPQCETGEHDWPEAGVYVKLSDLLSLFSGKADETKPNKPEMPPNREMKW